MNSPLLLLLLWLVPVGIWIGTRNLSSLRRSTLRGISFGAIVAPASSGLYALYFVGPIAAIFGMIGLVSTTFHGSVGFTFSVTYGLIEPGVVLGFEKQLIIALCNGVFWAFIYGSICFIWRYWRNRLGTQS